LLFAVSFFDGINRVSTHSSKHSRQRCFEHINISNHKLRALVVTTVRAEQTTLRTAAVQLPRSIRFTSPLLSRTQHYIWRHHSPKLHPCGFNVW